MCDSVILLFSNTDNSTGCRMSKSLLNYVRGRYKKIKFALEYAINAQRRRRGIALLCVTSALDGGWVVNATPRPPYHGNDLIPIV